ncbi:hypothetical protein V7O66_13775 [Methanolobus sp. ZRKC3]|uniref:hypothetical protein n=1 Tax=Methanolobus sp. ZRKC3 TaxID=3125786 RepID=UPI003253C4EE
MPEHDLIMQINNDIKDICRAVGRIEQKVDNSIHSSQKHCDDFECLEGRVTTLERKQWYQAGFAGGVALIASWIMGVFR